MTRSTEYGIWNTIFVHGWPGLFTYCVIGGSTSCYTSSYNRRSIFSGCQTHAAAQLAASNLEYYYMDTEGQGHWHGATQEDNLSAKPAVMTGAARSVADGHMLKPSLTRSRIPNTNQVSQQGTLRNEGWVPDHVPSYCSYQEAFIAYSCRIAFDADLPLHKHTQAPQTEEPNKANKMQRRGL